MKYVMVDYKQMYIVLFNGVTTALHSMEQHDYEFAQITLIDSQLVAEELYITAED